MRPMHEPGVAALAVSLCSVTLVLGVTGCTHKAINPPPTIATIGGREIGRQIDRAPEGQRIAALTREICGVSPRIDPVEASDCAARAIRYTVLLREAYRLTGSAEFNCFLVDMGFARRGKCYELADDLNAELREQKYRTLTFTRGICYWDEPLLEHNCIVLTAPGQRFQDGLVLDPWRNPGVLRWARVGFDVYPWIPRIVTPRAPPGKPSSTGA
jgi:hypothetical protein